MTQRLNGKVALVTGGSSGIGLATVKRFVEEGAWVYITGRRQAELDNAVKTIGQNVTAIQADVSKLADLDRVYTQIKNEKGHLDILFANAGVVELMPIETVTEAHFDKIMDINVKGLLFTVQKALPIFQDGGTIILNASVASISGMAALGVYSASKAAVRSFARTWTLDLKDRKIRVNAVSPGATETPIFNTVGMTPEQIQDFKDGAKQTIPMGRMGDADEIAKAVVFLASDESSYITGTELFVDGGLGQV